jgi:hypothetical protein
VVAGKIIRGRTGAAGIGVGAALFTPGTSSATLTQRARDLVSAWLHATNQRDNN